MNFENNTDGIQQYFDLDEYKSVVSEDLQVVGTEDKQYFLKNYLENINIRQKYKLIGTHSECFHCDEVMAISILLRTNEFRDSIIVRTRDQEIIDKLDIVCDVGGEFDAEKKRFDHHQRSFTHHWWQEKDAEKESQMLQDLQKGLISQDIFDDHCKKKKIKIITKLSSAGLIYKYYGKEIIRNICKEEYKKDISNDDLEIIFENLYKNTILEIDAIDNGVSQGDNLRFNIQTNLSSIISRYNLPWNAPKQINANQNLQFKKAMKICEKYLIHRIYGFINIMLPAKQNVLNSWKNKENFHKSGQFMYIDQACPWKEHLYNIEQEHEKVGLIKFVFYVDCSNMYRIQAVSQGPNSFINRVSISKKLQGLRGKELSEVAGVSDAEFVHANGFIGGAWSLESCIKIAEDSLAEYENEAKNSEQVENKNENQEIPCKKIKQDDKN